MKFNKINSFHRLLFALVLCLVLIAQNVTTGLAVDYEAESEARRAITVESNEIAGWPDGPVVSADAAILIEANTGTILYSKNIYAREYPASTTKLLTCLLAMEQAELTDNVTFSQEAVSSLTWDSSNMAASAGDVFTMEQTLYGILVGSANEGANAVAEHISGSMDAFAELMTERAAELGCVNSHFVNANGLYDDDHYTCAYDLAVIAQHFFQYDILCRMSSTYSYALTEDNTVYSHNRLLPNREYAYEYLIGSKTGYTDAARQTLVSCAEKDGMKLICVVLKEESPNQFTDTISLFNYGFSNFQIYNIADNEEQYNIEHSDFFESETDLFGSSETLLTLDTSAAVILPITADFTDAESSLNYETGDDSIVASIQYTYLGVPVGTCNLLFTDSASNSPEFTGNVANDAGQASGAPEEVQSEQNVIFINVKVVLFWVIGIAGVLIVIFVLIQFFRNYQTPFTKRRRHRKKRKGPRYQNDKVHF